MGRNVIASLVLIAAVAGAADAPGLRPGLWRYRNVATAAALDGRPLADLPAAPATDETVCLSPREAADPIRWLTRDTGADCTVKHGTLDGGKVDIAGTCPAAEDGGQPGMLRLTGQMSPTTYDIAFTTLAHGENGAMSFSGTMTGHRVGDCAATPR